MNNGIVKFNFKHILSQVVFKAKTQYDNMQVDIDVIKIHNFKFAGAFTLPAAADGTGSWSSSDLAFPHAFTVVKNANITVNSICINPFCCLCIKLDRIQHSLSLIIITTTENQRVDIALALFPCISERNINCFVFAC